MNFLNFELFYFYGKLASLARANHTGEPCSSLIAHNVDDIERFFKETVENRLVFFFI